MTNESKCSRRWGSLAKNKRLIGVVSSIELVRSEGTVRNAMFVTALYNLDATTTKSVPLNIFDPFKIM